MMGTLEAMTTAYDDARENRATIVEAVEAVERRFGRQDVDEIVRVLEAAGHGVSCWGVRADGIRWASLDEYNHETFDFTPV